MTVQTLTMPRLGETMEEGVIVGWLVAPGQDFKRGQPILELETDKTVVEFPALGDGAIEQVLAGPGERVAVGAPIAQARVTDPADWADSQGTAPEPAPASAPTTGPAILSMPRLGETMEEGVVVQWLVAEGSAYGRGTALLEIETDKTVAELPASHDGRLIRILAAPGQKVAVGAPLAEVEGEVWPDVTSGATGEAAPVPTASPETARSQPQTGRLRATPLARRIARTRGLALDRVQGTGRRGRIERADVERALAGDLSAGVPAVEGVGGKLHVLVHGFAGDAATWALLAAALRRAGHRTVAFDLPGHGRNETPAPDLAALSVAALQMVQGLPGPLVIVGHSMGAAVAVDLAAALGPRAEALILLTPAGCGPNIRAEFIHGMANATTTGEVSHLLRLLGPKGAATSEPLLAQMAAQLGQGRLRMLAADLASTDGRQRVDLLRKLDALPAGLPITALFGTSDPVVAATDALHLPPRVAVHFLPTGHMPQWDAVTDVVDLILKDDEHV